MGQLQVLQNKAAKVLLNLPPRSLSTEGLDRLDVKTLSKRRHFHCCVMMQKYLFGEIKSVIVIFILIKLVFHDLHLPRVRTNCGRQTFIFQACKERTT